MNTPNESKSQARPLTTTSYGVLSILALRDHSTYDLTRQMRMSLHYMTLAFTAVKRVNPFKDYGCFAGNKIPQIPEGSGIF